MRMATVRTKVFLLVATVLAGSLMVARANGQAAYGDPGYSARFTLPYEVHWGKAVLPAGEYSVKVASTSKPAMVQSKDGKTLIFTPMPLRDDNNRSGSAPALLIAVRGDEHEVLSLTLPDLGRALIFKRLTQAEREMIARIDHVQVAPVTTARK